MKIGWKSSLRGTFVGLLGLELKTGFGGQGGEGIALGPRDKGRGYHLQEFLFRDYSPISAMVRRSQCEVR